MLVLESLSVNVQYNEGKAKNRTNKWNHPNLWSMYGEKKSFLTKHVIGMNMKMMFALHEPCFDVSISNKLTSSVLAGLFPKDSLSNHIQSYFPERFKSVMNRYRPMKPRSRPWSRLRTTNIVLSRSLMLKEYATNSMARLCRRVCRIVLFSIFYSVINQDTSQTFLYE